MRSDFNDATLPEHNVVEEEAANEAEDGGHNQRGNCDAVQRVAFATFGDVRAQVGHGTGTFAVIVVVVVAFVVVVLIVLVVLGVRFGRFVGRLAFGVVVVVDNRPFRHTARRNRFELQVEEQRFASVFVDTLVNTH